MSIKDIISFEIRERIALQKDLLKRAGDSARIEGSIDALQGLLESFIDSLPEQPVEETPEPYTGVYDEAYLQEKIARATKSWEGVDVDKMLADCRGYEQPVEGLEEAATEFANQDCVTFISRKKGFIAGAEWMAEHKKI